MSIWDTPENMPIEYTEALAYAGKVGTPTIDWVITFTITAQRPSAGEGIENSGLADNPASVLNLSDDFGNMFEAVDNGTFNYTDTGWQFVISYKLKDNSYDTVMNNMQLINDGVSSGIMELLLTGSTVSTQTTLDATGVYFTAYISFDQNITLKYPVLTGGEITFTISSSGKDEEWYRLYRRGRPTGGGTN